MVIFELHNTLEGTYIFKKKSKLAENVGVKA